MSDREAERCCEKGYFWEEHECMKSSPDKERIQALEAELREAEQEINRQYFHRSTAESKSEYLEAELRKKDEEIERWEHVWKKHNEDGRELQAKCKRYEVALEKIIETETMVTAVHAVDRCYEIAKQALNEKEEG